MKFALNQNKCFYAYQIAITLFAVYTKRVKRTPLLIKTKYFMAVSNREHFSVFTVVSQLHIAWSEFLPLTVQGSNAHGGVHLSIVLLGLLQRLVADMLWQLQGTLRHGTKLKPSEQRKRQSRGKELPRGCFSSLFPPSISIRPRLDFKKLAKDYRGKVDGSTERMNELVFLSLR